MTNNTSILYSNAEITNPASFIHNFDVSVIMPFYKKMDEFKKIFPINQPYFERNGIEVIICMDENTEADALLEYINDYPFINWKVIVNHNKHDWRNPSKALNVAIRAASKEYILICSPESQFDTDAIYLMRKALYYYPNHFAVGFVEFKSFSSDLTQPVSKVPYGSIMAKKEHLIEIKGYDEQLLKWGGDDDNIRARLEMIGIKKLTLPDVKLIHWESESDLMKRKEKHRAKDRPLEVTRSILYPKNHIVNSNNWGTDFDYVAYDWQNKSGQANNLSTFTKQFLKADLKIKDINKKFKNILLTQSYNEIENIDKFLNHSSKHFDAIILLDDESDDGTYEKANHEKLILKVKKSRVFFNDLENRNLLLTLVSFFNTDWITFLDLDELLDERFCDFLFINDSSIDVVAFHLVHLWNDPEFFNAEYPYAHQGIQLRFRMFRNIGHSQIITDKKALHFPLTPYVKNILPAKVLILHYGHMSHLEREKKASLYIKEDKNGDQKNYSHLLNNSPKLRKIKDINITDLNVNLY